MTDTIKKNLELFTGNYALAKKAFLCENNILLLVSALIGSEKGTVLNVTSMKACKKKINSSVGIFSSFRGNIHTILSAYMATSDDAEIFLERAVWAYNLLKQQGFHASDYMALAAVMLAKNCPENSIRQAAERAEVIYRLIKTEHPYLTSRGNYAYVAMLASSGGDPHALTAEAEDCYNRLRGNCFPLGSLQSLSHVLALGTEPAAQKCEKTAELYKLFKDRKSCFDRCYALPFLGVLAMTEEKMSETADKVIEVSDTLRKRRGLGAWSVTRAMRLMIAASLVSCERVSGSNPTAAHTALTSAAAALTLAQQAAVVAGVTSCFAAAASSAT